MNYPKNLTTLFLLLSISQAWGSPSCEFENVTRFPDGTICEECGPSPFSTGPDGCPLPPLSSGDRGGYPGADKRTMPPARSIESHLRSCEGNPYAWHGCVGTQKFGSHLKYSGEYQHGKPNGQGIEKNTLDRSEYVGQWKDGKKHGQGIETNLKWCYEGQWKNGKKHGQGAMRESGYCGDGSDYATVWSGEYRDGQRWQRGPIRATEYNSNGQRR